MKPWIDSCQAWVKVASLDLERPVLVVDFSVFPTSLPLKPVPQVNFGYPGFNRFNKY
jgi:hypothetical protein